MLDDLPDTMADALSDALLEFEAHPTEGPEADALELVFEAMQSPNRQRRVTLAKQALDHFPQCAQAYAILAESADTLEQARDYYAEAMTVGAARIGEAVFEEDVGHFWGLVETRPYMRARAGLAEVLWELGETAAAMTHMRDLLRLNPGDALGLRYRLLSWLLLLRDDEAADALLTSYDEDVSTSWLYSKALLAFRRAPHSPAASAALQAALETNRHVPDSLLGDEPPHEAAPQFFAFGSPEEAASYAVDEALNWMATPGALYWLQETVSGAGRTFRRRSRKR
jgi:tetratricopeptide (TPR) repeat protein